MIVKQRIVVMIKLFNFYGLHINFVDSSEDK